VPVDNNFPKLFVTDLDSTALGGDFKPYQRFPDPFSEFLDRLAARGCRYAINTTWDVGGQWNLVAVSAVKAKPAYLMAELGLRLARYGEDGPEFVQPYTENMESKLRQVVEVHLHDFMKDVCGRFRSQRTNFYGHWFDMRPVEDDGPAMAEYVNGKYSDLDALNIRCTENIVCAYPTFLSKGLSVAEVLRLEKLRPEDVVIAGDSMMDAKMMAPELARHAVCPENADEQLKQHVTATDGVVGQGVAGLGVIDAFEKLARKRGWEF